jgi:hypothetical protein
VIQAFLSTVGLGLVTATVYTVLWYLDFGGIADAQNPLALFALPEASAAIVGLGEITIAVLGIAITVVAIIVELASNRYTPRISELFIRDPINTSVLAFFAVTSALVVAMAMSIHGDVYPTVMVQVVVCTMLVSIVSILPYFLYVFDFLTPTRVIARIQLRASNGLAHASRAGDRGIAYGRSEVSGAVEQLGEIALNSIGKKDKAIVISALNALAEVAEASLIHHSDLSERWFDTDGFASTDQDFVAFHPDIARRMTVRRTWVEMKVLRQYQSVFSEALLRMQDINHMVAIHTRGIGILAVETQHPHAVQLTIRFMHTYMRSAINKSDVRTAYNLFNEYRSMAESLLAIKQDSVVAQMAPMFRFYGQLAYGRQLPFILETAAYDMCTLLERSWELNSPCHEVLLRHFLELDKETDGGKVQETSLRGVRKAQIKLATWYLEKGQEDLARRIFNDMAGEDPERLVSIREELERITEPEFWEVSDRGINFDWLAPGRRAYLHAFFGWFEDETL